MYSRRGFTLACTAWVASGCSDGDGGRMRRGLPRLDPELAAQARQEGALRIDAAVGLIGAEALQQSFSALNPGIAIEYRRAASTELHSMFLEEASFGRPTADILLSSAMDLQFKLVNDGYAQSHESPEQRYLPDWASWKNQAYAFSAEPLVFAYNRALMPAADIPDSHESLADMLRRKPNEYRGKISSYDPERSGTGYLYYTQDLLHSRDMLDFVQAVGRTQPTFYVSGAEVREGLTRGEHLLAYNMVNSFLTEGQLQHPNIAIVLPSDYTLVMSRVALIPRMARHPAAAKLFLDFLLSERGQLLMTGPHTLPMRSGIAASAETPPPEVLRPIHFGPALLANLDEFRRQRVLHEWRRALES